jgi:hypothetical protein
MLGRHVETADVEHLLTRHHHVALEMLRGPEAPPPALDDCRGDHALRPLGDPVQGDVSLDLLAVAVADVVQVA